MKRKNIKVVKAAVEAYAAELRTRFPAIKAVPYAESFEGADAWVHVQVPQDEALHDALTAYAAGMFFKYIDEWNVTIVPLVGADEATEVRA